MLTAQSQHDWATVVRHAYLLLVKFIKHNQNYYLKLDVLTSILVPPVLDVKKAVVCVAQLVAALITVHGLLSFLWDVYGLLDPSGKTLWLSVDHRRLRPVDDMVL